MISQSDVKFVMYVTTHTASPEILHTVYSNHAQKRSLNIAIGLLFF